MTQLELKNHQVWQDLIKILENINTNLLLREHLEVCNYKVCGYWDEEDTYYLAKKLITTGNAFAKAFSTNFAAPSYKGS